MVDTQKLKELKELLDSGALTQAEFDAAKQKLIDMPGAIGAVEMVPTSGDMLLTMQKPDGAKLGITMDLKGTDVVVVSVIPGSITESSGVLVGDVVKMINGEAVSSPDDAVQKLVAASGEIKLDIVRATKTVAPPPPGAPPGGTLVHDKYCGPNTKRIAGCGPITSCIVYSSAGIAAAADPFGYAAAAGIITAIGTIAGVCCVVTPWIGCCPVDECEVYMLNGTKYRTTTGEKIERTC